MKETEQNNTSGKAPVPQDQSRRDAIKKLGKYGKVSAVVTAVVYSGFQSGDASAGDPPGPPMFPLPISP